MGPASSAVLPATLRMLVHKLGVIPTPMRKSATTNYESPSAVVLYLAQQVRTVV